MNLTLSGAVISRAPTADEVRNALRNEADEDGGFVILEHAPEVYVQTAGGILEYRDGERQFRSDPSPAQPGTIEAVFVAYLSGGDAWRGLTRWTDVTEEIEAAPPRRFRAGGLLLAVVVLAVVGWLLARLYFG